MPSPESKPTDAKLGGSQPETRTARVDSAHARSPGAETSAATPPAVQPAVEKAAGKTSAPALSEAELRQHARQLESYLQKRQQDLDHREAQLNARVAEFERESRAARLWFAERERELSIAQNTFQRPVAADTAAKSSSTASHAPPTTNIEAEQLKRELQLDKREKEISAREEQVRTLRDELFAAREETLEIRLATEELWRQLCDALPPEAVNRSVGRIRERLAEHYRLVREDLNDYRAQLEKLRCDLDEKLENWVHRKGELSAWVQQRMTEVDSYHASVSERAVALDQRQSELALLQTAWRQDRQELETRIARLQRRLDQSAGSAVPAPHAGKLAAARKSSQAGAA